MRLECRSSRAARISQPRARECPAGKRSVAKRERNFDAMYETQSCILKADPDNLAGCMGKEIRRVILCTEFVRGCGSSNGSGRELRIFESKFAVRRPFRRADVAAAAPDNRILEEAFRRKLVSSCRE
ncbi:hypothetical protein KM043_006995 [Ampulex compressa]|nr:hypothetical protein KM043_006995 [Ampulex compressa]